MAMACISSCSSCVIPKCLSSSPDSTTRIGRRRNQATTIYSQRLIAFARRGKQHTPSNNDKKVPHKDVAAEEDFDEDAIEALFNLLEEDLKNDLSSEEGDDEFTEEDLAKLEQELEEALGSDDEFSGMHDSSSENTLLDNDNDEDSVEDADGEDDDEERPVVLRKWQLRRLASALKIGRRKTSIQSLAAELCLDRGVVLELLRNPPPDLLLLSAALPDRVAHTRLAPETKLSEQSNEDVVEEKPESETEPVGKQEAIHVMQSRWSLQKRLKKVQVETLERVYNRTKRPTNAMISSVVHVTNLPRKRVVKWFEDKRAEDGVPYNRLPFQRSTK